MGHRSRKVDEALRTPDYVTWQENGKEYTQVSPAWKRELLADYAARYPFYTFVETGTCDGGTLAAMTPLFENLYSIELDLGIYAQALQRFKDVSKIHLFHGDSGDYLSMLLPLLKQPVLFWLDAHGPNWIGPIVKEMRSIFASRLQGVILVDDVDYMTDTLPTDPDWPYTEEYGIRRLIHVLG